MNTNVRKAIPSEEESTWTYPETQDFSSEAERGMENLLEQIQGFVHMLTTNEKLDKPQVNGPLSRPLMYTNELLKMARNQLAVEVVMRTPPESPTDIRNMTSTQANIHQRDLDRMHKVMKVKMDLTSMMQTIDSHVNKEGALKDLAVEGSRGETAEYDGAAVCRDDAETHRSAVRFATCDDDVTGTHFRGSRCAGMKTNQKNKCSVRTPSMVKQRVRQFEDESCKSAVTTDIDDDGDADKETLPLKIVGCIKKKDVESDYLTADVRRSSSSLSSSDTPCVADSVSEGEVKRAAKKRGRKGSKKPAMTTDIDDDGGDDDKETLPLKIVDFKKKKDDESDFQVDITRNSSSLSTRDTPCVADSVSEGEAKRVAKKRGRKGSKKPAMKRTSANSEKCDTDATGVSEKSGGSLTCNSAKCDSDKCASAKCDSAKCASAKCCKRNGKETTCAVTKISPVTCDAETGEAHTCISACHSTCHTRCDSKCDSKCDSMCDSMCDSKCASKCGSKCSSSTTENSVINTTKKEESEVDSEVIGKTDSDAERDLSLMTPVAVLGYHLLKTGVTANYRLLQRDALREPPFVATYNYECQVLGLLLVTAEGRSKAVAMQEAAVAMLALIVEQQTKDTLPSTIMHFNWKELIQLKPMLEKGVRLNAMNNLRRECHNTGQKMPTFKLLSTKETPSGKRLITVSCNALGLLTIGVGHNKRSARLDAATNVLQHHHAPRPHF